MTTFVELCVKKGVPVNIAEEAEERAAIIEYDAKQPRDKAEWQALRWAMRMAEKKA